MYYLFPIILEARFVHFSDICSFCFPSCVKRTNKEIGIEGNFQSYLQTDCALNEVIWFFKFYVSVPVCNTLLIFFLLFVG